ncbi:hypothetical protein ACFOET_03490 [Parapedobacter deserti]|uniref:DUF3575 domain-containing protein n=1 Tax=Parapedobacter deserti TaxID=1912957 RepID=A0ABV7JF06_9SPHI
MRIGTLILISLILFSSKAFAQSDGHGRFDIDIDPIALALNGFSVHGGYLTGAWRFDLGVFGLDIPGWAHGNDAFNSSFVGAGWKVDRFFKGLPDGFFVGIDGGIQRLNVAHKATGADLNRIQYLLGVRGGYRWNTGWGNLFITPWLGMGYVLNAKDVEMEGDAFKSSSFTPFPTVHIGWGF